MLVRAKTGFSGSVCMAVGEERDIPEGAVLSDLLRAGHVEPVNNTKTKKKDKAGSEDGDAYEIK